MIDANHVVHVPPQFEIIYSDKASQLALNQLYNDKEGFLSRHVLPAGAVRKGRRHALALNKGDYDPFREYDSLASMYPTSHDDFTR